MLIKSTVFNFLYIFQLIQKVLKSNFLNLVLNIHICLYKNSKILFLLEKNNFQVKISTFFFSQMPKSKAIFGIFVPSCPKSARNKVYQINLNFSKIQSAAMSVDVSVRSKKRISVQYIAILGAINVKVLLKKSRPTVGLWCHGIHTLGVSPSLVSRWREVYSLWGT